MMVEILRFFLFDFYR